MFLLFLLLSMGRQGDRESGEVAPKKYLDCPHVLQPLTYHNQI